MVDACYVTPYVSVNNNGNIIGMLDTTDIELDEAKKLINDEGAFFEYLKVNKKSVIEAEFVLMVAPLNPAYKPFPVCCLSSNSGAATEETIAAIEKIINILEKIDIKIMGVGTDGDRQYIKYSRHMYQYIIDNIELFYELDILKFQKEDDQIFHFSDPFHLLKRDRYRKLEDDIFFCSPIFKEKERCLEQLKDYGIPEYILCNEQARKMEDNLVLKFYSFDTLNSILENEDIPLFTVMYPCYALIQAIHNDSLTRKQRIDGLLYGFSFIFLFQEIQSFTKKHCSSKESFSKREYNKYAPFDKQWCIDYISTSFYIVITLLKEKEVYIGACGTHPLEHYFGNIRRICRGDDTHKKFLDAMNLLLAERYLCNKCDIDLDIVPRRCDSGQICTGAKINKKVFIIPYLQKALNILEMFIPIPEIDTLVPILEISEIANIDDCWELLYEISEKSKSEISTRSTGITSTGGFRNIRKWKAAEQINNI